MFVKGLLITSQTSSTQLLSQVEEFLKQIVSSIHTSHPVHKILIHFTFIFRNIVDKMENM